MRRTTAAITAFFASACVADDQHSLDQVEVSLASARAVSCVSFCASLLVDVVVKNGTSKPVCFSSRYLNSALGTVVISEEGQNESDGFLVNFPPVESDPDNPDRPEPFVRKLKSEPNIYLSPGQQLRFEVTALDSFHIPQGRPLRATLGMYVYPCEGEGFRRFSPTISLKVGEAQ